MLRNNALLWTLQILLAALYLFAGGFKLVAAPEAMQPDPAIPPPFPIPFLRFIGAMEVLGALGLVLPGLTGIKPQLTWMAAAGLAIIMIGAVATTIPLMGVGAAVLPFIVGLLAVIVMLGRRAPGKSRGPARAAAS
jgi:uncharacterized membrane protein YphA (DoxX/SURF4 family)